jgi:hypothetical protein
VGDQVQQLGHFGLEGVGVFCHGVKGKRTKKNGLQMGRVACISRSRLSEVGVRSSAQP